MQRVYEELLQFFNVPADLLCTASLDGRLTRLDPASERVLGWSRAELVASPFLEFLQPDDRRATRAEVDQLARGTTTIRLENRYSCQDSSWRGLESTAIPLPDGGGGALRHCPRCHRAAAIGGGGAQDAGPRAGTGGRGIA